MKKVWLILAALILVVGGTLYYQYNKKVESLSDAKPDVEVSAHKMLTDYMEDEKAANDQYLGKVVQVNGNVAAIVEEEGKKKVHLDTGNPMAMIICEIEDGEDIGNLKAGDDINMKGLCSGYLSDVILVQASVVK